MLLLAGTHIAVSKKLTEELAEVENRFSAELLSDLPCVNSLVTHVERYRGKMLRPMLVLVSGMACGHGGLEVTEEHRVMATVVEMVHMATLVHDDVLDEAEVRRRGRTINDLRGNETAVMLGDYLISHAYHLCSSLDSTTPARLIADATNTVCEGELLQLANRENWSLDEGTYFEIIRRKTASLCGMCCRIGAVLHQTSEAVAEALDQYGEKVGIAFQIVDDLLDLTGDEATVGKTLGRDLQKGKLTLPMIHYLATARKEDRRWLLDTAHDRAASQRWDGPTVQELRAQDEATGSMAYAQRSARRLIDEAKGALAQLPDSPAKALLMEMADTVLSRKA